MWKKTRILLVDDEVEFLFSACLVLQREGYRTIVVDNGEDALAMILEVQQGTEAIDLLITDMRMPGMSGLGLIDALRQRGVSVPVLAITGFGDQKLYSELKEKGCMERIEKPFEPDELVSRVRRMLEGVPAGATAKVTLRRKGGVNP